MAPGGRTAGIWPGVPGATVPGPPRAGVGANGLLIGTIGTMTVDVGRPDPGYVDCTGCPGGRTAAAGWPEASGPFTGGISFSGEPIVEMGANVAWGADTGYGFVVGVLVATM